MCMEIWVVLPQSWGEAYLSEPVTCSLVRPYLERQGVDRYFGYLRCKASQDPCPVWTSHRSVEPCSNRLEQPSPIATQTRVRSSRSRAEEHSTKMPKRKAKELDNGVPAEEPRRSSRRVSLPATKEEPPKTTNSAPKKPKKVQKPSTDESTVDKAKDEDNEKLVRILPS
jgi:hypothetical protein